jgi:hypothetical protein
MVVAFIVVCAIALIEFALLTAAFINAGSRTPGLSPTAARFLHEQVRRRGLLIEDLETKLVAAIRGIEDAFKAGIRAFGDGTVWEFGCKISGEQEAWEAYCSEKGWPAVTACRIPPHGWFCTREPGHEGPCAAIPIAEVSPCVPSSSSTT